MNSKQYAVLGLGIFGSTVATTLAEYGCEVIAVDQDESCVERVADEVTKAVVANVTDQEELRAIGIEDIDVAIVAIGTHLEEAVLATMNLKELGVPYVIAKAKNKQFMKFDEEYSVVEIKAPLDWVGKNFIDLNIRRVYNMNIIGIKHGDEDHLSLDVAPEYVIQNGDHFLVIGKTKELERFDYMTK